MLSATDPVAALRRIAYLLEATRAETHKVRAFRTAAAELARLREQDPGALERLAASRRLTDVAGVGDTTARVVTEALGGSVPGYLADLEARIPAPATGKAAEMRAALRGDCHSHSDWSDGGSPIAEMADAAADLGHEYLALTDHSPRLTVAHGLDERRLREQLEVVRSLNDGLARDGTRAGAAAALRVLSGIEVDVLEDGTLDQDDDLLGELDVVVASVHSKLKMEPAAMTRRMVRAIEHPHTDILGHCTGRILAGRGRPPSGFDPKVVFEACAATGTAVEINCRPERLDPPDDLLALAAEAGCLVAIDTDAHAPGQLEWLEHGCVKAADAGIGPERVVNSWSTEALLAWAADHGRHGP